MAKKKFDASFFMNLEDIEELDKFDDNSNIEDLTNAVMDVFKTPILLRTMAALIEKDADISLKNMMAKEINYRIMQILN
ncbi:hypothetical protein ACFSYG_14175 [Leeuwenhoekiella polynyae]|uniref:Uncharacterized protein n=1 Tax=Leeuwenhoekiella polynyae TaxID=1550906 RepID=A0A4Q0NQH1_9FLAO|nr:hypothetical protein [Leeuwenhoekiella polynyae]RXG12818.1 hypothetical protein DSM02_3822 [Leeuwenhoekiella polynyae]